MGLVEIRVSNQILILTNGLSYIFYKQSCCFSNQKQRITRNMTETSNTKLPHESPRVALFITCLVDLFRPCIGFSTTKLLEDSGCEVVVPDHQSCCGQPAFNSGDQTNARKIAEMVIKTFENFDYVVIPSGSCAGMLKKHYVELFENDTDWQARAQKFSVKVYELVSFLTDVLKIESIASPYQGSITYHDSCSGLRELSIHQQPRTLLGNVSGVEISEMKDSDVCCGFGGTFCVKYPEISDAIVEVKAENIINSGAKTVLAGDLGCLLNIAGKLKRLGSNVEVRHIAEVLSGLPLEPAIGEGLEK